MSAAALPGLRAAEFSRPLLTRRAARLVGYATLASFAALHWGLLVEPGAGGRMLPAVAVGLAAGVAMGACARLPGAARHGAAAGVCIVALLLVLAAAGVPLRLLVPSGWGDLGSGLAQGAQALPDLRLPYSGADEWPRLTLLALGGALAVLAAAAAFWPARGAGRPGHVAGLVALMVLYAVPAVDLILGQALLRGAAFAAGIAAFLWLERVLVAGAPAAAVALAAALGLGLVATPSVDRARPWLDYQRLAQSLAPAAPLTFDFSHAYGPLDWPRDGQDLLRIKARRAAYWKAENVDVFDGRRWRASPSLSTARTPLSDELPAGSAAARWRERIQVSVQGLGGHDAVTAGTALGLVGPPSAAVARASPGTFALENSLQRGDSYAADVYVPRPTPAQMATAGTDYGMLSPLYTTLGIRTTAGGQAHGLPELADVRFAPFDGRGARAEAFAGPDGMSYAGAGALLRESDYARSWALAQRLAARSRTPYEYARRILAFLGTGFAYSESPPRHAVPLEAFMFDDRLGYCQHFSGAMALLLRMGGVPARVAGGFSPGAYDRNRREYVVRDLDAHSWVEAYFPGYGWVTFDPTPSASPARSQLINVDLPSFNAPRGAGGIARRGDVPEAGPRASGDGSGAGGASPAAILAGLGLLALVGIAVAAGAGPARRRGPVGGSGVPGDEHLAELRRALRRCGRPAQDAATLASLERRLGPEGPAAAYLRALRERRFGFGTAAPTAGQRRGLRRGLAQGLGRAGRLRALWALPPRPGGWRGLLK